MRSKPTGLRCAAIGLATVVALVFDWFYLFLRAILTQSPEGGSFTLFVQFPSNETRLLAMGVAIGVVAIVCRWWPRVAGGALPKTLASLLGVVLMTVVVRLVGFHRDGEANTAVQLWLVGVLGIVVLVGVVALLTELFANRPSAASRNR